MYDAALSPSLSLLAHHLALSTDSRTHEHRKAVRSFLFGMVIPLFPPLIPLSLSVVVATPTRFTCLAFDTIMRSECFVRIICISHGSFCIFYRVFHVVSHTAYICASHSVYLWYNAFFLRFIFIFSFFFVFSLCRFIHVPIPLSFPFHRKCTQKMCSTDILYRNVSEQENLVLKFDIRNFILLLVVWHGYTLSLSFVNVL